jgi:putative ABC transport system permease protein
LGDLVDAESFDAFVGDTAPTKAFIDAKDGSQTDVEDEIGEVTDLRPDIDLQAGNSLSQLIGTIFDFLINAINGLLLMSVLVALVLAINRLSDAGSVSTSRCGSSSSCSWRVPCPGIWLP